MAAIAWSTCRYRQGSACRAVYEPFIRLPWSQTKVMMKRFRSLLSAGIVALVPLLASACQGGGTNPPSLPTGSPPPPGQLSLSPSSLTFSGTGSAYAQTVTITVNVATASLTVVPDAACKAGTSGELAHVANPTASGNTFTASVTPENSGTCTVTVSSPQGGSAQFTVTVNTASVILS
jgi:hypothetical protein